jgi:superfamily I DNA and/or RNA helicase
MDRWTHALLQERVTGIHDLVRRFNVLQHLLDRAWNERNVEIIKQKRIIGCTTTAAAKYTSELCGASPGVILVEEAGEILESHILTAMTPETKQLVLIGDHQQLRPKVNNYALTVEKGDGYNLNRSLFERLVLRGFPHTTLTKQHRMCPEISSLVRHLTYPYLEDDPKTLNRPPICGLQDRVIFFNHEHLEVETTDLADRRDQGSKNSKQNIFEVEMVLQCVRYLAQQGYGTDKQVILTPYLGQLRLLRDRLSEENDPILNDLDSFDLVRAGLLSPASANISKRPIRISTIGKFHVSFQSDCVPL